MRANKLRNLFYMQVAACIMAGAFACNSDSDVIPEMVVTSSNVAVKDFYILPNEKVMTNIDSVFFSIDLAHGVIFNADSMPQGTNVSRLIPSITFANTMSKVELVFYKDNNENDTTVDYLENATDSIDFTRPVRLDVTAQDGVTTFSYTIKVNIHTVNPDTMQWASLASSRLPSRLENPRAQKTILHDSKAFCIIEENNGSYTLSTCSDLNEGAWDKKLIEVPDNFMVESFIASDESFYALAEGHLLVSNDAISWGETGETWLSIIGGYQNSVLGIKYQDNKFLHARYPAPEGFEETEIDEDFPISHSSQFYTIDNSWAKYPTGFFIGGVTPSGSYSSAVWAFDGTNWATINSTSLPELKSPMLVRYVVFRNTGAPYAKREFDAWLMFGGVQDDGYFNRDVYYTLDNGVVWTLAPSGMQLPDRIPDLYGADAVSTEYSLSADLSQAWQTYDSPSSRASFTINGSEITWECPYIYIFGGYDENNLLSTSIWRGVLNRVKFTPSL